MVKTLLILLVILFIVIYIFKKTREQFITKSIKKIKKSNIVKDPVNEINNLVSMIEDISSKISKTYNVTMKTSQEVSKFVSDFSTI